MSYTSFFYKQKLELVEHPKSYNDQARIHFQPFLLNCRLLLLKKMKDLNCPLGIQWKIYWHKQSLMTSSAILGMYPFILLDVPIYCFICTLLLYYMYPFIVIYVPIYCLICIPINLFYMYTYIALYVPIYCMYVHVHSIWQYRYMYAYIRRVLAWTKCDAN